MSVSTPHETVVQGPSAPREEVEEAFRHYFLTGIVNEDWVAWSQLFTDDAVYKDHFWGTFHGPSEVEAFLEGTMSAVPQVYSKLLWYAIDGDRVVYELINQADSPVPGQEPIGFNSLQHLHYAGNGKWSREEDWWVLYDMVRFRNGWVAALAEGGDPDYAQKMSRADWGDIDWARPEPGHHAKPSWVGKGIPPILGMRDITFGERAPKA
jgi:limonene-1,2-epoxide hydrolase